MMALICVIPFAVADGQLPTALAAGAGAFLIWSIVRRINLAHDRREGKGPLDPR
jgi:hypothetical protein